MINSVARSVGVIKGSKASFRQKPINSMTAAIYVITPPPPLPPRRYVYILHETIDGAQLADGLPKISSRVGVVVVVVVRSQNSPGSSYIGAPRLGLWAVSSRTGHTIGDASSTSLLTSNHITGVKTIDAKPAHKTNS